MAWAALYFLKLHGGTTRGITLNDSAAVIKHTQCLKIFTRCYENFANAENTMYPEFQGFNKPTRNCSWPRRFFATTYPPASSFASRSRSTYIRRSNPNP